MKSFPALIAALGLAVSSSVRAEVTRTDLQAAARALSFMERPLTGTVRVGILYAPDSPRSVQQAQDLERLLAAGMQVGRIELRPALVKIGEAATANVDMYFLTEFVDPAAAHLARTASANRPCVTTDIDHVESGSCLMGVRSRPRMEIVVNREAAKSSGITFATVFRVMITEI
jgi:ABC-type uncharacterized transport system substrate-binding protein